MDYEIMGTKNKAVTAYLPEDIEACLAEFCLENGLSRQGKKSGKEKPALGTGIIEVLRLFFSASFEAGMATTVFSQDELQAIVAETLPSTLPTQKWVKTEIKQAIASLKSELKPASDKAPKEIAVPEPEIVAAIETSEAIAEEPPAATNNNNLILNQTDLARRLNSNPSTLNRHQQKGDKHFSQWSKAKDPEKLAWQYNDTEDNNKMFIVLP